MLVLQHPTEARHPLNTARLAVLGLQNAELRVGECFPELEEMMGRAGDAILLFPSSEKAAACPAAAAPVVGAPWGLMPGQPQPEGAELAGEGPSRVSPTLLIVPDGTWRQARRIVQANPILETLRRLSLPEGEPSRYRVRKARETAAVSTLEAIVRALSMLEPERNFQPLLGPFNVLIEQQIAAMGPEVYRRNHGGA